MIPTHPFGATGHSSSRTLFGAAALGNVTQQEADETLELLLEHGVNHIDTAASYGASEERIGPWMRRARGDFFLATKTGERTKQKAHDEIRRSLERLQVDQVDLIQLHCLVDEGEWQVAMGPGGALEAAIEARDEGLARFIGVTGHGLEVTRRHAASLERFAFDSVLLPWNFPLAQNATYAAEFESLVATCAERDIAVQTIKSTTRGPWGQREQNRATWYEPLEEQADIDRAVSWIFGRRALFLNTPGDIHVLPKVLEAAARFEAMPSDEEMREVVERRQMAPLFV